MTKIEAIISIEWSLFNKVQGEDGRASCQDDFGTFEIMRKSQFLSWDPATLDSYLNDLQIARRDGRNLIQEKYARMMASTAPEQYASFAHTLPELSHVQRMTIEEIVAQQLAWRDVFAVEYPHLSSQSRLIRSEEDTPYETSFETYLRGELGTYSAETLQCYAKMIDHYVIAGKNITMAAMSQTAMLYGYRDLASAEEKLAG
jgi:hypothetical protein